MNSYRQHWWKCNGPCQKWPPFYGVVKRAMNRAPAPRDTWWDDHKRKCGGEFTKVKEPENYGKRKTKSKSTDKLKDKGKNVKTDSKPNLPTFFDKMKKNQSKVDKVSSEDSSSDEDSEGSVKKPKLEDSLPSSFQAFTGKGHVLGGTKTQTNILEKGLENPLGSHSIDKGLQISNKSKDTNGNKSLNAKKRIQSKDIKKKTVIPSYTIVEAFARGNNDTAGGSKDRPIDLCDDELPGTSSDILCPSCQSSIPLQTINSHLDTCLAMS